MVDFGKVKALIVSIWVHCALRAISQPSYRDGVLSTKDSRKLTTFSPPHCNPHFHNDAIVHATAKLAHVHMEKFPTTVPISDRLLVMVLFSQGFRNPERMELLKCSLKKLKINAMQNTTMDVLVWVPMDSWSFVPPWLNGTDFPRVSVIPIPIESWRIPCGLKDDSTWAVKNKFNTDYYIMGRWRLTFSLDLAKKMGYAYHLQFDDDAMLNSPLNFNLVDRMRSSKYDMAVFSDILGDNPSVLSGLPELTKYWLYISKYTPAGTLLTHLRPKDMNGLTTDGWDRLYHPGYFLIINVDWWFQDLVQDYLTTVLRSGRDVEGRWQEQGVMNMMRLIFIPPEKLWVANEVDIGHDRHKASSFEAWCRAYV